MVNFAKLANSKVCDSIAIFYKKNEVYANNWSAKNRDQLVRKIQKCSKEFDMAPILKMFDHLKGKIMKADQHGLRSLTKK